MNNSTPTKKRGRPEGSNSFVRLRVSDLVAIVGNHAVVPVSKVWLRENSIDTNLTPATVSLAPVKEVEAPIEFALTTFED